MTDANKWRRWLTGLKLGGHRRWVYVFPGVHLAACCVSLIGFVIPSLQYWAIAFEFVLIADLPVSAVTYMLGWKYQAISFLWIFVVGTAWWFLIGCVIEILVDLRGKTESLGHP
jgi:hypothetical protein